VKAASIYVVQKYKFNFHRKNFSLGAGENFEKKYCYGGKNQWIFKFLYKSVDFLFQKLYKLKVFFFSALAWIFWNKSQSKKTAKTVNVNITFIRAVITLFFFYLTHPNKRRTKENVCKNFPELPSKKRKTRRSC
jgi:hypothetical protein